MRINITAYPRIINLIYIPIQMIFTYGICHYFKTNVSSYSLVKQIKYIFYATMLSIAFAHLFIYVSAMIFFNMILQSPLIAGHEKDIYLKIFIHSIFLLIELLIIAYILINRSSFISYVIGAILFIISIPIVTRFC
jgi:hypothetical protein